MFSTCLCYVRYLLLVGSLYILLIWRHKVQFNRWDQLVIVLFAQINLLFRFWLISQFYVWLKSLSLSGLYSLMNLLERKKVQIQFNQKKIFEKLDKVFILLLYTYLLHNFLRDTNILSQTKIQSLEYFLMMLEKLRDEKLILKK